MASLIVEPLRGDLAFGAQISGVTFEALEDEAVRQQIRDLFEKEGLLVFKDVDPSGKMHLAISNVIGPLKDHPVPSVGRVDQDVMPGVIDMKHNSEDGTLVEIDGKLLISWLPWHFDHCYNNELNRAGVLRAVDVPENGAVTRFADGVELYNDLSPELREKIDGRNVIYSLNLSYKAMRFGRPYNMTLIRANPNEEAVLEQARRQPRAIHPAVWTRETGEKVLHVSPWMSFGIEGEEDQTGDALLEDVCQQVNTLADTHCYTHEWNTSDMLVWDNWRVLHSVSGMDPSLHRRMHRTTIKGDYGLGYFEGNAEGGKILEMTV